MIMVIISGPEATGKSEIARKLSKQLYFDYLSKDMVKEALFDDKDHSTWDFKWYESLAKQQFFHDIELHVAKKQNVIVESNFIDADKERLANIINEDTALTEIYCTTKGFTSLKRFISRNEHGQRHPGHHDRRWYLKIFLQDLLGIIHIRWPSRPTGLAEKLLVVDTTDFSKVDFDAIAGFIKQAH